MSLTAEDRSQFVTGYTRLLVRSWSDDSFAAKLGAAPVDALADAGVSVPADAEVEIVHTDADPNASGEHGIDAQVELYERGLRSGAFTFYVPAAPTVPTQDLASGELHGVAAGGIFDPYCCSCCPSCCSASGG